MSKWSKVVKIVIMIKNEQKWSKMVKMIKNDQFSYLEYLFLSVPRPRGPLPWRFKPKTKKMMRPCNTLAIFNRICNGMGTEIRSDEINQAITSKTHVKPKATKSFKNVLILYHKKSLYMRIIKYYISQCLKITEKSLISTLPATELRVHFEWTKVH